MRVLWAAKLVVAMVFVSIGTARAQFVGVRKPRSDRCHGHQERPAHGHCRQRPAAF